MLKYVFFKLKKIDIIIINYNGKYLTEKCINSIFESNNIFDNIIVVDNASTDNSISYLKNAFKDKIMIVENKVNGGYAYAVNAGMKHSGSDISIISNNDVIYLDNSINFLVNKISDITPVTGPQQIFPNGEWQRSYGDILKPGKFISAVLLLPSIKDFIKKLRFKYLKNLKSENPDYLDGAVICVKRELFEKLDGFDENFFFYFEETDFCYRVIQSGYKLQFVPESKVIHLRGASSKDIEINDKHIEMYVESALKFITKHYNKQDSIEIIRNEIIKSNIFIFIWKIISFIPDKRLRKTSIKKLKYFQKIINCWKTKKHSLS